METNLYCSCSNAMFYFKTLCIGNQHNLGNCILDVQRLQKTEITFNGVSIFNRFSRYVTS